MSAANHRVKSKVYADYSTLGGQIVSPKGRESDFARIFISPSHLSDAKLLASEKVT